jgi:hypothetical protein
VRGQDPEDKEEEDDLELKRQLEKPLIIEEEVRALYIPPPPFQPPRTLIEALVSVLSGKGFILHSRYVSNSHGPSSAPCPLGQVDTPVASSTLPHPPLIDRC